MGLFFALLSPLIFAVNNFFDKYFLEKYRITPLTMTIFNGVSGCVAGLIVFLFSGYYYVEPQYVILLLFSGLLMIFCVLPYYKALHLDETSRVIPLFQFTPIFVLFLGFLLLNEKFSLQQYFGALIVVVGSFLISTESIDGRIFKLRPAFWYMLLSSLLYALSLILYKFGVEKIPFQHTLTYEGMGMFIGALLVYFLGNKNNRILTESKTIQKKAYKLLVLNETIYISARYTTYFALSLLSASLVNILLGLQPLFGLILGVIISVWFPHILKEVVGKKALTHKLTSIFLIFIGIFILFH